MLEDCSCAMLHVVQILKFAHLESDEERIKVGKEVYDMYIMRELLSQTHVSLIHIILLYFVVYISTYFF